MRTKTIKTKKQYTKCLMSFIAFFCLQLIMIYPLFAEESENRNENTASEKNIHKPFQDEFGYLTELPKLDVEVIPAGSKKKLSIDSFPGNVVILFFTTSWCPKCPAVFSVLDDLVGELEADGVKNVKVVPLFIEASDAKIKEYYETSNAKHLKRFKGISSENLDIRGVPTCIVINKKGKTVWGFSGAIDYSSSEFKNFIVNLSRE